MDGWLPCCCRSETAVLVETFLHLLRDLQPEQLLDAEATLKAEQEQQAAQQAQRGRSQQAQRSRQAAQHGRPKGGTAPTLGSAPRLPPRPQQVRTPNFMLPSFIISSVLELALSSRACRCSLRVDRHAQCWLVICYNGWL